MLYAVLETLQVQTIINRYCPSQREIDTGTVAVVLILNRLLAPRPLCHIADWVAQSVLVQQLGLPASKFNDDRLARTLDALAPHGPAIWAEIVDTAQRRYDLDLSLIFYDLTAFVTHGDYAGSDLVKFGMAHNTPSNKRKVKAALGAAPGPDVVTADGNVPIDYWPWAGNTADKTTVQSHLERLGQLLRAHGYQTQQVLVVGDRGTLDDRLALVYDDQHLRYLAGLQPQKKVHQDLVYQMPESRFYQQPLIVRDEPEASYWGVPVAVPFEHEGQRVTHRGLVVLSGPMRRAHADTRTRHFQALWPALNTVAAKAAANTPHYRSAAAVLARAETQLRHSPVGQFVAVWTTGEKGHIQLHWRLKVEALHAAMERDGRYLLVTNDPTLTPQLMLTRYRQKDGVEKRNAVCKQDLVISPIHVHQDERIQALLVLNMVALLTYSLVERQLRQQGCQLTTRRVIAQLTTLTLTETHCRDGSVLRCLAITPEHHDLLQWFTGKWEAVQSAAPPRVVARLGLGRPQPIPLLAPLTR
ncbi:MAG: IS1634 family transposase [Chloroflexi bacterium]|nr:IS1634 family transposase [Chloroflexota bacterium]MBU1878119.1 IS1634 family transposase [Chloroflexota bacterium]